MTSLSVTIDGKTIQADEGTSVLQSAKKAGIIIPTLCHDEALEPYGACRFCMVEIEKNNRKKLVASCCYPVEKGLIVRTKTENVDKIRKILAELLLSVSPSGAHVDIAKQYGIVQSRFKQTENSESPCSLCGLCVRYCAEVKKKNAVCFVGRGIDRTIALVPGASDTCSSCRECFNVCDAGKIVYLVDMVQEISCLPLQSSQKRSI
ncbi:MAG TPA: (2Fe-2S)-binding protein [Thermoplasmata archaeon]|nr:MAG TPA: (2Fe-2S)-binding protein [Thermoplasmata archaeon]